MIYEIINPSDKYTLETDNFELACLATILLGKGRYALTDESDNEAMPIFMFGGHEAWFQEKFGKSLEDISNETDDLELATVLRSVLLGDRVVYQSMLKFIDPDKQQAFRDHWHNERRTSLNDIGQRAWGYADALEKRGQS